ncbi:MAG: hypothetical protein AAGG75_13750 [Bacteroidota bacterium]
MKTVEQHVALPMKKDPLRERYQVWPSDYFPFNLPASSVEKIQEPHTDPTSALITWDMDSNIQMECGVVDEDFNLLFMAHPRASIDGVPFQQQIELTGAQLQRQLGFTFTWVYFIPHSAYPYVPKFPMGVIPSAAEDLIGRHTIIKIRDTRK